MAARDEVVVRLRTTGGRGARQDLQQTERSLGNLEGEGKKAGRGLERLGKVGAAGLAGLASAAVGAVAAVGVGVKGVLEKADARVMLQAQLGLSAGDAAAAGKLAGKAFAGNYGENLTDVNDAIAGLVRNTGLKIGDASLQGLTEQALTLRDVFGQDLAGVTASVGQMIRTGLVKDASQGFDVLTVGFQKGADKAGDLLDTFNEYGVQFRKLGLDGPAAVGLLTQGLKGGARDADLVADAFKEFGIRAVDGSTASAAAFRLLGLDATAMTKAIGAGGPTAAKGLDAVLDKLRATGDPLKRNAAAVGLFGTQAEDLGGALSALDPSAAVRTLGAVTGAAQRVGDAVAQGPSAQLEAFKRKAKASLVDYLGAKVVPALTEFGRQFRAGTGVGGEFRASVERVGDSLRRAWPDIKALGTVLAQVGEFTLRYVLPPLARFAAFRFGLLIESARAVIGVVGAIGQAILGAFRNALGVVEATAGVLARIPGPAQSTFKSVADAAAGGIASIDRVATDLANLGKTTVRPQVIFDVKAPGPLGKAAARALTSKQDALSLVGLAAGGPVRAGQTYLVGENGPELFRANRAGMVIDSDQTTRMMSLPTSPALVEGSARTSFSLGVRQAAGLTAVRPVAAVAQQPAPAPARSVTIEQVNFHGYTGSSADAERLLSIVRQALRDKDADQ